MNKRNPYIFTIGFNERNPQHLQAAEILNQLGRGEKADYLVRAILMYEGKLECGVGLTDMDMLRRLIRQVLPEQTGDYEKYPSKREEPQTAETVVDVSSKADIEKKSDAVLRNISMNLSAFRGQS